MELSRAKALDRLDREELEKREEGRQDDISIYMYVRSAEVKAF